MACDDRPEQWEAHWALRCGPEGVLRPLRTSRRGPRGGWGRVWGGREGQRIAEAPPRPSPASPRPARRRRRGRVPASRRRRLFRITTPGPSSSGPGGGRTPGGPHTFQDDCEARRGTSAGLTVGGIGHGRTERGPDSGGQQRAFTPDASGDDARWAGACAPHARAALVAPWRRSCGVCGRRAQEVKTQGRHWRKCALVGRSLPSFRLLVRRLGCIKRCLRCAGGTACESLRARHGEDRGLLTRGAGSRDGGQPEAPARAAVRPLEWPGRSCRLCLLRADPPDPCCAAWLHFVVTSKRHEGE